MSPLRTLPTVFLSVALLALAACAPQAPPPTVMTIRSEAFGQNSSIPSMYTCDGTSLRPGLMFSGVPDGTVSLAIIVDDPDAASGTFTHWTAWNIPPNSGGIASIDPLDGVVQGITGAGRQGYAGPCPPSGTHRYIFHLYALSAVPALDATATVDELKAALQGTVIEEATLTGLYERSGVASSSSAPTATGALKTEPGSTIDTEGD